MPTPELNESIPDFLKRCIPQVLMDGAAEDVRQAVAVCYALWQAPHEEDAEFGAEPRYPESYPDEPEQYKGVLPFRDLPLADRERPWDSVAAERRVRAWAGAQGDALQDLSAMDWNRYAQAFFWRDSERPELLGSYKLGYADVLDGTLTAIPRAIFSNTTGGRGFPAADIPEADKERVKAVLTRWYAKLRETFDDPSLIPPWDKPLTNSMKTLSSTADELRVGNYLVLFGGRDLEGVGSQTVNADGSRGEYFTPETQFESDYTKTGILYVDWEHGHDPDEVGLNADRVLGYVDWKTARIDALGLWVERVLKRRSEYMQWLELLIQEGLVGNSSQAVGGAVRKAADGRIEVWPLKRDTFTVQPMEPRMLTENALQALKALAVLPPGLETDAEAQPGAAVVGEAIALTEVEPVAAVDEPVVKTIDATGLPETEETMELEQLSEMFARMQKAIEGLTAKFNEPAVPVGGVQTAPPTPQEDPVRKAVNILRHGVTDEPTSTVMHEIYGGDYREILDRAEKGFVDYLRRGGAEQRRQLWSPGHVLSMLKSGMTVQEIKTTMVEGTDVLGGYAVPPQVSDMVISRLAGMTAVRGGGATVVQTASKVLEWLQITGGSNPYPSALRGAWGSETQTPAAKNLTFGLLQVPVKVYTYKLPMSTSLLEDATNIVEIFNNQIAQTLAVDEDYAFLTGDGNAEPYGILPDQANDRSLTEVNSGDADDITWNGLRKLRRGVNSQYRTDRACFIGNNQSGEDIELMVDGNDRYRVEGSLIVGKEIPGLGHPWRESQALPDPAAGVFPVIFGDLSGYAIVERLGLAIQRYNDSYTGINVVEFHVRRRIGGDLVEPWKLAVAKCSA